MDISRTVESRIQASLLQFERRVRAAQNGAMGDGDSRPHSRSLRMGDLVREAQERAGVPSDRTRIGADTVDLNRVVREAANVAARVVPIWRAEAWVPQLAQALALRAYAAGYLPALNGRRIDVQG